MYRTSIFVFVCTLAGAVGLAAYFRLENHERVQEHINGIAAYAAHWMEDRIASDMLAVDRMARRWIASSEQNWDEWQRDAERYVQDVPEIRAIEWANEEFLIQRIVPFEGNEAALHLNLADRWSGPEGITEHAGRGEVFVTNGFRLAQGGHGFVSYQPLYPENEFSGLMISVFDVDALVDLLAGSEFGRETAIAFGQGDIVYGRTSDRFVADFSTNSVASFAGRDWLITVYATPELVDRLSSRHPVLALILGLATAIILSAGTYSFMWSRREKRELALTQVSLSKELAVANQRFEAAVAGASVGIWDWVDVNGEELWWSPVCFELLEYEPDEFETTQSNFLELLHPDDVQQVAEKIIAHFLHREPFRMEYRLRHKSGEYRWVLGSGAAIRDGTGRPVRMVGSIMDIHELKLTQQNLEQASRAKSDFLANMSHEIRTPMNGVLGMAEVTLMSELPNDIRSNIEIIKASGEAMMVIVNDILDISKIEAGHVYLEEKEMSFEDVVATAVSLHGAGARAKGIDLSVENPAEWLANEVLGDELRIQQVLGNLLSNAVKFTARGSIHVVVTQASISDELVRTKISITDTGIGLPNEKIGEVFEPFTQADSSMTRKYGGTGLGLSIVRELARMMGGEAGATSEVGKGSTFWFTVVNRSAGVTVEKMTEYKNLAG